MIHDTEFYKLRSCVETDKGDIDRLYRMMARQTGDIQRLEILSNFSCFGFLFSVVTICLLASSIHAVSQKIRTLEKTPRSVAITYTPPTAGQEPSPGFRAAFRRKSGLPSLPNFRPPVSGR